ncbi:Bacterial extracellular solute-binding protein, family 5 [Corynebacterium cystitidis DSM 20524]|uniref:Peptide/nickel transport system substrate-binding protein n=2 Tax=Corynebacterium cystitidis TaxID=35757 RepID=A0A1H9PD55_9CORY|nr:ABC transporter substrate-binding protein [Corynebacterium cystitidis]WJY82541.1 Bacterial extracellular solute-binding protein, family 5 [Corynebacterium cystitidis DSM 20524]SER46091.1 peptide/nickel transport system substrate-binding protein [Corynebacterium cystitidis DSM 20524]SNV73627.1 dipeptide-binding protein DciAE [Corynebacterium cystitidis]
MRIAIRFFRSIMVTLSAATLLFGCAETPVSGPGPELKSTDHFGYQVAVPLLTTNAGSEVGVSTNAHLLSVRLYPAVFVPGPSGQMIPNSDLVTTQVLPGAQRQVVYTLSPDAVFSDGTHVTCTDFLLAYKAGAYPELFGSHMPVMDQVERLNCLPGAKQFTAVFKPGQGGRWRELFGPGTVLPSHAVARKVNMDATQFVEALESDDPTEMEPIARVWREGFNLANYDPEMQVSFGPFRIDGVGDSGEVTLVRNDYYYGDQAALDTVVVWPSTADSGKLVDEGALRVGDIHEADPAWVDLNTEGSPYTIETRVGELTDTLRLEESGAWAMPEYRQALAKCIDRNAVAAASSAVSGVDVPAVGVHVVDHFDPLARQLADIVDPHIAPDFQAASLAQATELRVGYSAPNERKAAMVEAMRVSCEPAGIAIIDATEEGKTLADVGGYGIGEWGEQTIEDGSIDAFLGAVDPLTEYSTAEPRSSELEDLRAAEEELWAELSRIPLAAQPRSFIVDRHVGNVVVYTGTAGIGWNMDRWQVANEEPTSEPD